MRRAVTDRVELEWWARVVAPRIKVLQLRQALDRAGRKLHHDTARKPIPGGESGHDVATICRGVELRYALGVIPSRDSLVAEIVWDIHGVVYPSARH